LLLAVHRFWPAYESGLNSSEHWYYLLSAVHYELWG
jgi:hypothetical protein